MVERRQELDRRYTRKKKMRKLKAKLTAPGADREKILAKIHRLSPWWTEASLPGAKPAPEAAPAAEAPKKKAPPKKKPAAEKPA